MNGLFPIPDTIQEEMEHEIGYPLSSLKTDATTTNLNFLSPIGFSRLQNRYRQASSLLKTYGINMSMEQFPFIRLPTGHILTEPSRNLRFISFTNPLQSLLFPLRSRKIRQEIIDYLKGNHKDASRSFAYFQLINIICSMTKVKIAAPLITSPFEYEPTLSTPLPENPPRLPESPDWNELRNYLKYEYLRSERKIRDEQEDDPLNDRQSYEKELAYSIYDPLGRTNKTAGFQWVSGIGTEEIDGTIVTEHTMREQQSKAEKLIFVGDYFPNEYIVHLHQFSGILLTGGSHLSHSAIVARERSIPYLIGIPEEKEKELRAEEKIRLSLPSLKKIH
jgi:phosphohistidine swiveling domain-containing protein